MDTMGDRSMADDSSHNGLRWWAAIGTAITVLTFLGVHNAAQLDSVLSHALAPSSTTDPQSGRTPSLPAPPVDTCTLYCKEAHFDATDEEFDGACTRTGCPVTGTFTNDGHAPGSVTVDFFLKGAAGGLCVTTIPVTDPGETSTAGCNAVFTAPAPASGGSEDISTVILNPVG
jgi:hypothetical protein